MVGFIQKLFGGGGDGMDGGSGSDTGGSLAEPELTFARANNEIQLKTQFAQQTWGLGEGGTWGADLETGIITFQTGKGYEVTAPVQVIGTLNSEDDTWLWGWDHPSVTEALAEHARLARDFGEEHGLAPYTTRKIDATQDQAWTFTALACHLAGAQGAYRGPAGPALIYMTFGEVTIRKNGT